MAIALASCMLPEKFIAEIEYQPDASYHYRFEGTAFNVAAVAMLKKSGKLTDKALRELELEARKIRSNLEVKKAAHVGDGRFELLIEGARTPGQITYLFNFLRVITDRSTGVSTIVSTAIKDSELDKLMALGIPLKGQLKVRLPANAQVLSHNADSSPLLKRRGGDYTWNLRELTQRPIMTIRFAEADVLAAGALTAAHSVHNDSPCDMVNADCIQDSANPLFGSLFDVPPSTSNLWPLFALAAWTLCVVLLLAYRRVRATMRGEAPIAQFSQGDTDALPAAVILVNRNYMNLLEMPVLFYVIGVLAFAAGLQDPRLVTLGWAYVVLRVLHSLVHLSYNHVLHRFALFAASNVVLVIMWVLTALHLWQHG